ncbi:hypothetical protein P152DRAFT_482023 [Eremomyces bilateralis CBS 781.70]|uniref:Uncharacterized protein n=1 Tax=Eremomyces bilateralis CBS 781.70 TaxID=1392243 RepID=A0A6G1G328_9PEZI|nr:uncharacterized protein P152DRAFT_482023 [Eremomyces bilateralis CBS 781.70]KAF1812515.1 hypothetical protein P152DRAFT_482023 [Eremomyces bilateralis CBS 781.70]
MGKKLGLSLPGLKVSDRKNPKVVSKADEHSPISPIIYIPRLLDPQTEQELRAACAAIAKNYEPDDIDNQVLRDLEAYTKIVRDKNGLSSSEPQLSNHPPAPLAIFPNAGPKPTKSAAKPGPSAKDLLEEVNKGTANLRTFGIEPPPEKENGPQQAQVPPTSKLSRPQPSGAAPPIRPKTAPTAAIESSEDSYATPASGSTKNVSTAITSLAITPARSSNRGSEQKPTDPNATSKADAAATEWMQQELEKRRLKLLELMPDTADPKQTKQPPPSRSTSRVRTIRDEIKEYIRPRGESRPESRSSGRARSQSRTRGASTEIDRPGSAQGWRSWSLQRKSSTSSLAGSRPASAREHNEPRDRETAKKEINLNRKLPPLPGLDQWDREEKKKEENKKKAMGLHIANLMQPNVDSKGRLDTSPSNHRSGDAKPEPHNRTSDTEDASPITDVESRPRGRYSHSKSSSHSTQYTNATADDSSASIAPLPESVSSLPTTHRDASPFPVRKSSIAHRNGTVPVPLLLSRPNPGTRMEPVSLTSSPIDRHKSPKFPPSPHKYTLQPKEQVHRTVHQKPRSFTPNPVPPGRKSEGDLLRRPNLGFGIRSPTTLDITALPPLRADGTRPTTAKGREGGLKKMFSMLSLGGRRKRGHGEGDGDGSRGQGAEAPVVKF